MISHVARLGRWWYVFRRTASDVAILKRAASPRLDSNSDYRESNKASSRLFIIIAIRGHLQHPSPPTPDLRRRPSHKSLSAGLAIISCDFLAYQIITLLRKICAEICPLKMPTLAVFLIGSGDAQGISVVHHLVKDGAHKVRFLTRDVNSRRAKALFALRNL